MSINTSINCACVVVVTVHSGVNTSLLGVTVINSARIVVVTSRVIRSVNTSECSVTRINSANNSIITILRLLDTSLSGSQGCNNTSIMAITRNWLKGTRTSCGVTVSNLGEIS